MKANQKPYRYWAIYIIAAAVAVLPAKAKGFLLPVKVDFYGHKVTALSEQTITGFLKEGNIQAANLSKALRDLEKTNLRNTAIELFDEATDLRLDGIGYFKLLDQFVNKTYAVNNNSERQFIKWFMLKNLGYDCLLGYTINQVQLYGRLDFKTEGTRSIKQNNKSYTNLNFYKEAKVSSEKIFVCPPKYDSIQKAIDLNSRQYPLLNAKKGVKKLAFHSNKKLFQINAKYNKSLNDYLGDMPVIAMGPVLANAGFTNLVKASVLDSLRLFLKNKNKMEAIAFLNDFVQEAVAYKSDQAYLAREKHNFVEETLFADFADCEDKALLLAALSKELLGLNSMLIHNEEKKHMAVAVEVPKEAAFFSFLFGNKKFIICEPAMAGKKPGETALDKKNPGQFIAL